MIRLHLQNILLFLTKQYEKIEKKGITKMKFIELNKNGGIK